METQVFGSPPEVTPENQEVTREDDGVLIQLTMPFGITPGNSWRAALAEPVSLQAGETLTVEVRYSAPELTATHRREPTTMPGASTLNAVYSLS